MTAALAPLHPAQRVVAVAGIAALLVLPCVLGSLSSVVAVLAGLLLMPLLMRDGAIDLVRQEPALMIMAGVFVVLTAIFAITARVPYDVLYATNFLALAVAPAAYLAARTVTGLAFARLVVVLCLVGAAAAAAVGVVEVLILHGQRAAGLFGNANLLPRVAIVLGFTAIAGVWLFASPLRFLFYLAPIAAAAAVVFSDSRGAALGLSPLMLLALVFLFLDRATRWHVPVIAIAAVIAMTALALGYGASARILGIEQLVAEVLHGGDNVDFATAERLQMYSGAVAAFKLSPWIGHGWANFGEVAASIDPTFANTDTRYFMFHNDALNFAVAGGVVGIACWIALLFAPLAGALRSARDVLWRTRLYACLVLTVGYAVLGLTDMAFGYDLQTTAYAGLAALVLGGMRESRTVSSAAGPAARP